MWGTSPKFINIINVNPYSGLYGLSNKTELNIPEKKEWMFVYNFILEELEEYKHACETNDIVEVVDALGDIMYVLCNGILLHGVKNIFDEVYQEIQDSNMSKICSTEEEAIETVKVRSEQKGYKCHYEPVGDKFVVYRSSDRKVQKSIKFFAPDLKSIVEKYTDLNK